MKLTLRSVIASALMAAFTGSAWADQAVLILRGASMQFETQQPINASTANRGGDVPLRLIRPLVIDGTVVLPPGFESHGVVVRKPEAIGCNWLQVQWSIDKIRMRMAARPSFRKCSFHGAALFRTDMTNTI
jgi:hypothetical protein